MVAIRDMNRAFVILATVIALAAGFWSMRPGIQDPHREFDEQWWMLSGEYFAQLVQEGDFSSQRWEPENLGAFGSINPHLGQFILAGTQRFLSEAKRARYSPEMAERLDFRLAYPTPPKIFSDEALTVARVTHACAGLLSIALAAYLAAKLGGATAPLVLAVFVLANPLFSQVFGHVYTDGFSLMFLLSMAWSVAMSLAAPDRRTQLWWEIAFALSAACAFNVKATALVQAASILVLITLFRIWKKPATAARAILTSIATFGAAVIFACALNPYFWPTAAAPAGGGSMAVFQRVSENTRYVDRSPALGKAPVLLRLPEMHLRWRRQIRAQAAYFSHEVPSRLRVVRRLIFDYNAGWFGLATVAAILWALGRKAGARFSATDLRREILSHPWQTGVLICVLTQLAWALAMIPLDWGRYYLPAVVHLQIVEAAVVSRLFCFLWQAWRHKPRNSQVGA